jgi:hypothetical protein
MVVMHSLLERYSLAEGFALGSIVLFPVCVTKPVFLQFLVLVAA